MFMVNVSKNVIIRLIWLILNRWTLIGDTYDKIEINHVAATDWEKYHNSAQKKHYDFIKGFL